MAGLGALNRSVMTGKPLPKLQWSFTNGDGNVQLNVVSDLRPSRVAVWSATAKSLDFRNSPWTSVDAQTADAAFVHKQPVPAAGYSALIGEALFHEGTDNQFWLSTDVRIVPSKVPSSTGSMLPTSPKTFSMVSMR